MVRFLLLAQYAPPLLRRCVQLSWVDRWASMLGIALQDALAASLLAESGKRLVLDQSAAPALELDILLDGLSCTICCVHFRSITPQSETLITLGYSSSPIG